MMRGNAQWNYGHYQPVDRSDRNRPYINHIIPRQDGALVRWDDESGVGGMYVLSWRNVQTGECGQKTFSGHQGVLEGLLPGNDYRIRVRNTSNDQSSDSRMLRCGTACGRVVNYLHPRDDAYRCSGRFLASPSLARTPSGALIVSMDVFEWHGGQNLTLLFESHDGGETWQHLTELFPCFWGVLFMHHGVLYELAMSTEYGDLIIGASYDEGESWTAPVRLFPGSGNGDVGGLHKAPAPVIEADGRLVTAIDYGSWESGGLRQALLSVDVSANLLDPGSWRLGEFCDPRQDLLSREGLVAGGLEGNAVLGPDGHVYDLLRLQMNGGAARFGKALLLESDEHMTALRYRSVVDFNGGSNSKFFVIFDAVTCRYWAVANEIVDADRPGARTVLSLSVSSDLRSFVNVHRVVDFSACDDAFVAAQYPSALIDGDDLLIVSRTAVNGADSYHNSNYITFHRVHDFRGLVHEERGK